MAKDIQEILGKSISSTKELREEIKRLQDSLVQANEGTEEWVDSATKLNAAQEKLASVTAAGKTSIDAAKDSIVGMEKEYKSLYNTYKLLSEEQRNSSFGQEMANQLNTLSDKLNSTKKDVGNFKDNIGRYSEGVMSAFSQMGISVGALQGPMKMAAGGAKALGTSLKALIANPVGAIIMAIVVAFKALSAIVKRVKEAINSNEESQMALKEAMSAFQPVIDAVSNAFDKLGQIVVKVIGFIGQAFAKMREIQAAVTDFLGITKGANDKVKEQNALYKELAKSQNELTKNKREYQKLNASDKAEVERLREEASETKDLTEKKKLLEEAKAKQAEIDERNIEIAKEELRILEEQSKLTANDAAMNDRLAAAVAKVSEAEAAAATNARQFNKQLNSTGGSSGGTSKFKQMRDEAEKLYQTLVESSKSEIELLDEKYEKEKKLLEKFHKDTTLLTQEYLRNKEKIEKDSAQKIADANKTINEKYTASFGEGAVLQSAAEEADRAASVISAMWRKISIGWSNERDDRVLEYKDEIKELTGLEVTSYEQFEKVVRIIFMNKEKTYQALEDYYNNADNTALLEKHSRDLLRKTVGNNELKQGIDPSLGLFDRLEMERQLDDEILRMQIEQKQEELALFKGTEEEKLAIKLELQELQNEAIDRTAEREAELGRLQKERNANLWADTSTSLNGINTLIGGLKAITNAQLENGKIDEKEKKKKEKRLKALQILETAVGTASVIVDTAAGIMGIWRGYAGERVANAETAAATGPAAAATYAALNTKSLTSAILQTAGMAATGAGQLAAIAGNTISSFNQLNDGKATATPTAAVDTTPYSYTRQLQTEEEEQALNRPIYVTVTDINEVQNKVKVVENETTF